MRRSRLYKRRRAEGRSTCHQLRGDDVNRKQSAINELFWNVHLYTGVWIYKTCRSQIRGSTQAKDKIIRINSEWKVQQGRRTVNTWQYKEALSCLAGAFNLILIVPVCLQYVVSRVYLCIISSVRPVLWPQTERWRWRTPGAARSTRAGRARRYTGRCCSTSWSSCRRWRWSCWWGIAPLRSCCTQPRADTPSFWCPRSRLWSNSKHQALLRVPECCVRLIVTSSSAELLTCFPNTTEAVFSGLACGFSSDAEVQYSQFAVIALQSLTCRDEEIKDKREERGWKKVELALKKGLWQAFIILKCRPLNTSAS